MKILLSNKFYYPKGGDCIHTIELEKLLLSKGHEVAIFAIEHALNLPTKYSRYFPTEISYASNSKQSLAEKILRPFGTKEVKQKFRKLMADFKPDIVHVNNIHSHLSPIIVNEANKKGIPVVWTLHDYKLLCPRYDCLLNNKPCELCYTNKRNVILNRCTKNSLAASLISYAEAKVWNTNKLQAITAKFICPSEFMRQKMISGGFAENKLVTVNNFKNISGWSTSISPKENYYCFVGRLSVEKGIETLLKAASKLTKHKLKIVGSGPLQEELIKNYSSSNIEFLGQQTSEQVNDIVAHAAFLVLPSEWYENNPLSIIESLCLGTPVLGAKIGGIPKLIDQNINGLLFTSGNETDLAQKINHIFSGEIQFNYQAIADKARHRFSSDFYYNKLTGIYNECIKNSEYVV